MKIDGRSFGNEIIKPFRTSQGEEGWLAPAVIDRPPS
jgi:hypothetical protein